MESAFQGRVVCLVDDCSKYDDQGDCEEAGARRVIFASCAPPITHPHIYDIDLASPQEFIAQEETRHNNAKHIKADDVIYQDLEDLKAACTEASPPGRIKDSEVGVFCGKYNTKIWMVALGT
ncbi:Amidophosphoribosyltransferase [Tolypocladium ophioglossoides CBS 100239]|uniref:Amidophosphoribosyltransferase n=1 Tax=Tolypocladium ophioglossoides (strain CBS 100239) TaxID=1163406 RepID=A0A0L0NJL7_TOLOC|nr:Amidophosphoribosyltransferase [Tolypocladium ophioglossoides CBS 100239]